MAKNLRILGLALALGLVFMVPQAYAAADACFTWSCNSSGDCDFDASCSSATPFIWKYSWTWGDGTSTGLTGNSTPSHDYGTSGPAYPYVTLKIYPWSDETDQVTCQIVARNVFSPPLPQSGTCD